jgi:hypothetical protein
MMLSKEVIIPRDGLGRALAFWNTSLSVSLLHGCVHPSTSKSSSERIAFSLWNPNIRYHVRKSPLQGPITFRINLVNTISYFKPHQLSYLFARLTLNYLLNLIILLYYYNFINTPLLGDRSVSVVTATDRKARVRIPAGIFMLSTASTLALGPTSPPLQWTRMDLSQGKSDRDVKLTTRLQQIPRSNIPPLPEGLHSIVLN